MIVEEFSSHLQVELPANLAAPLIDVFRLQFDVTLAIESNGVGHRGPLFYSAAGDWPPKESPNINDKACAPSSLRNSGFGIDGSGPALIRRTVRALC
jgi:hypothetical protein